MQDDERCCGTGTCIIDPQGHCWCGQQWDGEKMCRPSLGTTPTGGSVQASLSDPDSAALPADAP